MWSCDALGSRDLRMLVCGGRRRLGPGRRLGPELVGCHPGRGSLLWQQKAPGCGRTGEARPGGAASYQGLPVPFLFMGPGELQSDKQGEDGEGRLGSQEPPCWEPAKASLLPCPGRLRLSLQVHCPPQRLKLQR